MAAVQYGSDTVCVTDVPFVDTQTADPFLVVGQRVARRLQTPRGGLASVSDDPNFGWDVRQYLNAKMSPTQVSQAQRQVEAECLKDEEVQSATCTITFVFGTGALTIAVQLVASAGPFTLVLNVSQLTTTVLFQF
jgi:hypothetical protein